ncbi:MAG: HlyD family efflux transporter periplasmic adaptor subunit [Acidobacteria bacterium]|nr:HlyD family efflux transporter periplasmic adaptor subunit [Acidobacteriota bacterium]MYK87194.1 HlyD family efflux transporter periplasmic adaptor subunit [Acidobacteriota bacterium]
MTLPVRRGRATTRSRRFVLSILFLPVVALLAVVLSRPLPMVDTAAVRERDMRATVAGDCLVQAQQTTVIRAGVSGILQLETTLGSRVRAGQVLARIGGPWVAADRRAAAAVAESAAAVARERLTLRRAQAGLWRADRAAGRATALWREGHVAASAHDAAVRDLAVARGDVAAQEAAVAEAESLHRTAVADQQVGAMARRDAVVRAPVNGVVSNIYAGDRQRVRAGQGPHRGTALLALAGDTLTVEMLIAAVDVERVDAGQQVAVRVVSHPDDVFRGAVSMVGYGQQGLARFPVRVAPVGDWTGARAGVSCDAVITTATRTALAVPNLALLSRDDALGVLVVRDGRVTFRPLSLGIQGDMHAEIVSGATAGDVVVTGPVEATDLPPGARVAIRGAGSR